jgi:hypothetical protein
MAEVRISTKKVVALILEEQEARWLKAVMQNNLHGGYMDESAEDTKYREAIFTALNSKDLS